MIEIGLQTDVLAEVLSGNKTIEGRLGKEKFLQIRKGDIISLRHDRIENSISAKSLPDDAKIKVDDVDKFNSFREMIEYFGFKSVIPFATSTDEAVKKYSEYYTSKEEGEFGVVAISFHLISS